LRRAPAPLPAAVLPALLAVACANGADPTAVPSPVASASPEPRLPLIVAAGDISCQPGSRDPCRQEQTATLIDGLEPDLVLPLGDNQYESGTLEEYSSVYSLSWGRHRVKSKPVPGNHEYQDENAKGYFNYFNGTGAFTGPVGDRDRGYYSYNFGNWHFVALNSNCTFIRGCGVGSPQYTWLRDDLGRNDLPCTIAYSHHPRFSSGINGSSANLQALWQVLYDFGADVFLCAHDHHYERFAPQRADGTSDPTRGIREFVVGTGGRSITPFQTILPNSDVQDTTSFGVLALRLGPGFYEWKFVATPGMPLADSGTGLCH
jgi:calcineurin-like phosphoesterase family protein